MGGIEVAYIFEAGKSRRVMHLARLNSSGGLLFTALCGIDVPTPAEPTPASEGERVEVEPA